MRTDSNQDTILRIPARNYISPDFAERENKNFWPHVWQVVCREEELEQAGDFTTYDIADESIVVVKRKDGSYSAYHNVCPHRGRKIAEGCGHAPNFRCRYHNWTFGLDGKNISIQDRDDWNGGLDNEEIDLKSVQVDTWAGFVWINIDPNAVSLKEWLGVVPEYLDPFEFDRLRIRWAYELHIDCNWKVALEAFMEGYHVAATHPQLLAVQGDDYTMAKLHGRHAQFGYFNMKALFGQPSPRLNRESPADVRPSLVEFFRQMEEDFAAVFTDRDYEAVKNIMDAVPAGAHPMEAFGAAVDLGRKAAEREGCGYPEGLTFEVLGRAGADWSIFPNNVTLPYFDGAVWYRSRPHPDNPTDKCIFTIYSLKRYGEGLEPKERVKVFKEIDDQSFKLIIDQDLANMKAVQRGMKSSAFAYARPNPVQESMLHNFHKHLESYVYPEK